MYYFLESFVLVYGFILDVEVSVFVRGGLS